MGGESNQEYYLLLWQENIPFFYSCVQIAHDETDV